MKDSILARAGILDVRRYLRKKVMVVEDENIK